MFEFKKSLCSKALLKMIAAAAITSTTANAQTQFLNAEFECKSSEAAIVSDVPDFDQFKLKGQITSGMNLQNVSLRFNNYPLREAFFSALSPVENGTMNYHFFDGQDYRYEMRFPKISAETSFKSKITISLEGYISTETLECTINP